jgi:hypothetical protein
MLLEDGPHLLAASLPEAVDVSHCLKSVLRLRGGSRRITRSKLYAYIMELGWSSLKKS